jgi:hypothetical protein
VKKNGEKLTVFEVKNGNLVKKIIGKKRIILGNVKKIYIKCRFYYQKTQKITILPFKYPKNTDFTIKKNKKSRFFYQKPPKNPPTMMFSGFRSLCTTLWSWQKAIPAKSCRNR